MKNKYENVLIIGASGFIGRSIIEYIFSLNKKNNRTKYKIIAVVRNIEKAEKVLHHYLENDDFGIVKYDDLGSIDFSEQIDWIICLASSTSKEYFCRFPVETYIDNVSVINNCLKVAKIKKAKGVVFTSSSIVYGRDNVTICSENLVGKSDWNRDPYLASKISGELLCNAYFSEYDVPVKIARLFQVYGKDTLGARGTFMDNCMESYLKKKDIIIDGSGKNVRNLIHVEDAASAIWEILINGIPGETYNVGSLQNNYTFLEIAQIFLDMMNSENAKIVILENENDNEDVLIPDITKLSKLGWIEKKGSFKTEIKGILAKNDSI